MVPVHIWLPEAHMYSPYCWFSYFSWYVAGKPSKAPQADCVCTQKRLHAVASPQKDGRAALTHHGGRTNGKLQ